MTFRAFKSKSKPTENNSSEVTLPTLLETQTNDYQISDIKTLQDEIEYKEKHLNIFINHVLISLNSNIDDMKLLIDQNRSEKKIYKLSICDLWLRLKTIEQMGSFSLVSFLRENQLHRPEIKLLETNNDIIGIEKQYLINPRRSRLIHFHIYIQSDEFYLNNNSYVGLLIFSYNNQSKFILNGHYCQSGDIIIKNMKFFNQIHISHRGIYNTLFKWYFSRSIDEKFFGIGFLCLNGRWRFDLITYDDRELFLYEYRIFDMFMLTHWLTQFTIEHNVEEMEMNAKDLLLKQYDIVKKKLIDDENTELLNNWNEFIGSDIKDLHLSIERFIQTIDKEIEIIFKKIGIRKSVFSKLLTQNTR